LSYPIVRRPGNEFFPFGGSRNSQRFVNDHRNPINARRLRSDPLKDGYDADADEDPTLLRDRKNDKNSNIPY